MQPEFRPVTEDGKTRIFVAREGSDWWRIRYQVAHEVFHWLCTPPGTLHWTHEFFAVETGVRAMAAIGELDYARREMDRLKEQSGLLPLAAMLTTPLAADAYPAGLYGRAWVTGRGLTEAVGWVRMKLLVDCLDKERKPDIVSWMRSFSDDEQRKLEGVVGSPSSAWV